MEKEIFLGKFSDNEQELIEKYLPLRGKKKIHNITILEPLVKDIVEVSNMSISEKEFLNRNCDMLEEEIDYLPISIYKAMVDEVLSFANDKKENNEEKKDIKKN